MSEHKKNCGATHPVRRLAAFFHETYMRINALWLIRTGHDRVKPMTDEEWWARQRGVLLARVAGARQLGVGIHKHLSFGFPNPGHVETEVTSLLDDLMNDWLGLVAPGPVDDGTSQLAKSLGERCRYYASRLRAVPLFDAEGRSHLPDMDEPESANRTQPNASRADGVEAAVKLQGRSKGPIVLGKEKSTLTTARYDVVALLEAGEQGLAKDQLDRKSNHGDARKILKRLADSDADWAKVILMAGQPDGGYRIRQTAH